MLRIGIFILFFISGFTGLVYEVVWTRLFGLVFGNTTLAVSTVLSAYMLGLASGSIIIGKKTDKMTKHVRAYALLELGIGLTAVLIFILQGVVEQIFSFFYAYLNNVTFLFRLVQFVIAFVLMFPATFFMGGTLPLLGHVVVKEKSKLGCGIGQLYGINTLGAMAGCFATGFILIRTIGISHTVYLTALTNLLIATLAFVFYRFFAEIKVVEPEKKYSIESTTNREIKIVIWAIAISGFTALSYEVLWNRVLVFVLTNSVFAFSVMLTTFLCGISLGGFFGGKWVDKVKKPLVFLGWVECAIGFSGFIAAAVLVNLSWIHDSIFSIGPKTSWWLWNGIRFLEAFLVMFIPTFFMGISFPIAGKIAVPRLERIGSGLGKVYFYNTLGGVIGSFATGFILISLFGTSSTLIIMVLINIFLGFYLLQNERQIFARRISYAFLPLVFLLFGAVAYILPPRLFSLAYSHVEKGYPLIDFRDGVEGTVTVHESARSFEKTRRIDVDGLNVAGSSFILRTLQTLQGHLPLFVRPDAKNVLQIGFGTGQTSHSALFHSIQKFNLVEISKDVLELGDIHFQDLNHGVIKHPNFNCSILDGKNYIKYTQNQFDIIMNDANYAVATSSASLFTKEHFENCRKKLVPGGIVSTWMTVDLDPEDFVIVLKTFQDIFPYSTLWMAPNCVNKQIVLIGSTEPLYIDFQKAQEKFTDPEIKNDLADININSIYDLLSCLVLDYNGIRAISENVPVNSDDHPILEFSTNSVRSRDLCAYRNIGEILVRRPDLKAMLTNLPENQMDRKAVENTLARFSFAADVFLKGILETYQGRKSMALKTLMKGSKIIPESRLAAHFFQEEDRLTNEFTLEAVKNPNDLNAQLNLIRHKIGLARFDDALSDLKRIRSRNPNNALVNYEMARCYFGQSNLESAKISIKQSLEVNPKVAGFWYLLGEIERREQHFDQALEFLDKAIQLDSRMYEAHNGMASIYKRKGDYLKAIQLYKTSLLLMEYQPGITADLADCYFKLNEIPMAVSLYQKANSMGLNSSKLFFNLGNAYYLSKDFSRAAISFKTALSIDSSDAEIYYNLGNIYVIQKQLGEAAKVYKKAITINVDELDYFINLAMTYKNLGQLQKALEVFEAGIQYHPNSELLRKNVEEIRGQLEK